MSTVAAIRREEKTPVWGLAIASFLPTKLHPMAHSWMRHLPLGLILLAQVALSLRLSNSAFEDEALYIAAGHDYLRQIFSGTPVTVPYGGSFSGLPMFYPVLAAALDTVGGLGLVRIFSLVCMVVTTLAIRATAQHLWGKLRGNLTAAAFIATGPVLFLGSLATFDALCLALLSTAVWIGTTRCTYRSAVLMGVLLAAAAAAKYTGFVFIPVVLAITLVGSRRKPIRPFLAGAVAAFILAVGYFLVGPEISDGIAFTTSQRSALMPASLSDLVAYLVHDIGLLLVLALAGAALLARSFRSTLLTLALLSGGALLPLAQMRLGEYTSFEKHLGYSALFLAPLAGRALGSLVHRRLGGLLVVALVWILCVAGLARSWAMYQWPDVRPVVELVEKMGAPPGQYLAPAAARTLGYYMADNPRIVWAEHYGLFDSGQEAMRASIEEGTFQMIILRSGSTGNVNEDSRTSFFREVVVNSDKYRLVADPFPVRQYAEEDWLVYELVTP
jgi:hypothetical protein